LRATRLISIPAKTMPRERSFAFDTKRNSRLNVGANPADFRNMPAKRAAAHS
jgi:hypothetical protein